MNKLLGSLLCCGLCAALGLGSVGCTKKAVDKPGTKPNVEIPKPGKGAPGKHTEDKDGAEKDKGKPAADKGTPEPTPPPDKDKTKKTEKKDKGDKGASLNHHRQVVVVHVLRQPPAALLNRAES